MLLSGGIYSDKLHTDPGRFNLFLGRRLHFAIPGSMVGLRTLEAHVFSELDGTSILPNGRG